MNDAMIVALEAAWENDPIRFEDKLWKAIDNDLALRIQPAWAETS